MKLLSISYMIISAMALVGCGDSPAADNNGGGNNSMGFHSNDIQNGGTFSDNLTPNGSNESPHLSWKNTKGNDVRGYAVVMDDITTNPETVHWNLFTDDPTLTELETDVSDTANLPNNVLEGTNYEGNTGYAGPFPPQGETHTYKICVYLLGNIPDDTNINQNSSYTNAQFSTLFNGDILDSSCFEAKYTGK